MFRGIVFASTRKCNPQNCLPQTFFKYRLFRVFSKGFATDSSEYVSMNEYYRDIIGNREIVGYGIHGCPLYQDREDFPFPSIRYKPPTPDIQALLEKQKGDWRLLTLQEKKAIYRANFRQTFSEFQAPTGQWMYILGMALLFISGGLWLWILQQVYVCGQIKLPYSFHGSSVKAQLRRQLNFRVGNIQGLSSRWDYDNMKWKSKPWYIPFDDPFDEENDYS